jgi:hypothetical protein
MKKPVLLLLLVLCGFTARAQHRDSILLTGIVFDADSAKPLSNVNIARHSTGTVTDRNGYFEISAGQGDTVVFTFVGFREARLVMPAKLNGKEYYTSVALSRNVISLKEVEVFPWPKEAFKQALLTTPVPDRNLENAQRNLNITTYEAMTNPKTSWSNEDIQRYYLNQFSYKVTSKDRTNALQAGVITPVTPLLSTNTVIGLILLARQLRRQDLKQHDFQDYRKETEEKKGNE